ncbi:hypothetical protein ACQPZF_32885 [Actinosynnema sp. CS-041913]|uniref:hypothetical protein n=1 Tax=Actinosynnema sp. CS-041913 TaxID=3239917 RepID=UPI003D8A00CF
MGRKNQAGKNRTAGNRGGRNRAGRNRGVGRPRAKPKNWFTKRPGWQQTGIVLAATALGVGGHFFLWGKLFPVLGEAVGHIPVLSTVVGWLFAGGAFGALGIVAINHETAKPENAKRLKIVAWVWSAVAVLCIPTGYANGIRLPTDFWAGVYAGAYGVAAVPLAFLVVVVLWALVVKLVKRKGEPTGQPVGWVLIAYSALLLVWGSTLLRS